MYICYIMKRFIIVISLLSGVLTTEGKPKYRIESWTYGGTTYYQPQRKVWYRTNYFPLPIKVWETGSYPFQNRSHAIDIINNWKSEVKEKHNYKISIYTPID